MPSCSRPLGIPLGNLGSNKLAKMVSIKQSKQLDNKRYTMSDSKMKYFIENLTVFLLSRSDRKYS